MNLRQWIDKHRKLMELQPKFYVEGSKLAAEIGTTGTLYLKVPALHDDDACRFMDWLDNCYHGDLHQGIETKGDPEYD
jgi:hypothetical protein